MDLFDTNLSAKLHLQILHLKTLSNRPYSYSQYRTGTSLQVRLMQGSLFKYKLHSTLFNDIPHMNLHCMLLPVQYREYEYDLLFRASMFSLDITES